MAESTANPESIPKVVRTADALVRILQEYWPRSRVTPAQMEAFLGTLPGLAPQLYRAIAVSAFRDEPDEKQPPLKKIRELILAEAAREERGRQTPERSSAEADPYGRTLLRWRAEKRAPRWACEMLDSAVTAETRNADGTGRSDWEEWFTLHAETAPLISRIAHERRLTASGRTERVAVGRWPDDMPAEQRQAMIAIVVRAVRFLRTLRVFGPETRRLRDLLMARCRWISAAQGFDMRAEEERYVAAMRVWAETHGLAGAVELEDAAPSGESTDYADAPF